jgi:hypothetical protein
MMQLELVLVLLFHVNLARVIGCYATVDDGSSTASQWRWTHGSQLVQPLPPTTVRGCSQPNQVSSVF